MKLFNKALKLGPPFSKYNEWTERVDVLRLTHKFNEQMRKCWAI